MLNSTPILRFDWCGRDKYVVLLIDRERFPIMCGGYFNVVSAMLTVLIQGDNIV